MALAAAVTLLLAACGDDDDTADTETTEETSAETETSEAADDGATSDDGATTDDDTAGDDTAGDEAAAPEGLPVELGEWYIDLGEDLDSGSTTFALTNASTEFPHAFAIARGTSYEELPQLDNGAVDTDALGDDFLGQADNVEPGQTGTVSFDLEAGDYVIFCPIQFGPNSHAARGQVLSITIG
jgi:hypothetical protein